MISFLLVYVQDRTVEEQQQMIRGIQKRDKKRRNRIKAAGIDYECPDLVSENVSFQTLLIEFNLCYLL